MLFPVKVFCDFYSKNLIRDPYQKDKEHLATIISAQKL
jgi:hypothetical protein